MFCVYGKYCVKCFGNQYGSAKANTFVHVIENNVEYFIYLSFTTFFKRLQLSQRIIKAMRRHLRSAKALLNCLPAQTDQENAKPIKIKMELWLTHWADCKVTKDCLRNQTIGLCWLESACSWLIHAITFNIKDYL